jgi:16S rRNA (uracil1498-N3)-methyltransferase
MTKKIHRFFLAQAFSQGITTITNQNLTRQISKVLKLKATEPIVFFNAEGIEAAGVLQEITGSSISVLITDIREKKDAGRNVTLYAAILKNDHFDLAVEKAVETGVKKIIPILTNRTVKTGLKKERLIKIITEATEQCGRTSIPILEESISFKEAITEASKNGPTFLFDPSGTPWNTLTHPLPSSMHIFIGPEGGFTEEEITFAQESGTTIVSLGSNILRGETAVTIATYLAVETN